MVRTFTGSFVDEGGARRLFRLDADSHEHAERLLEDLACTGRIDVEVVDEGESDMPFEIVGRA